MFCLAPTTMIVLNILQLPHFVFMFIKGLAVPTNIPDQHCRRGNVFPPRIETTKQHSKTENFPPKDKRT